MKNISSVCLLQLTHSHLSLIILCISLSTLQNVNKGEAPCVLSDGAAFRLQMHFLCQLFPVESIEATVLTEFCVIVVGSTHFDEDEKFSSFPF